MAEQARLESVCRDFCDRGFESHPLRHFYFLITNLEPMMKKPIFTEELIAPCGMNCGLCSSYLTLKYNLKKTGVLRTECPGCRPRNKQCYYGKKCSLLGQGTVHFCYECGDFPCRLLKTLDKRYRTFYHMSMIENLEYIKSYGIRQFLTQQTEKWRCPQCGGIICCHNGICYNCSIEKLLTKKRRYRWEDT